MNEPPGEFSRPGSVPDDDRLADWVAQVGNRIAAGESVDVDRLATEYPEGVEELLMLVPAMEMVARLRPKPTVERGAASADVSSASMFQPMSALGDFRMVRVIGRGGMGVVYEAVQISLNRRVALKILPMASADDPRKLKRFQIEAQAAALLNDPHIVPVHMVGSENGVHFYVMQLIEGRTLSEIITEIRDARRCTAPGAAAPTPARLSARFVAELGRQAALALHHAHEQGIVHRDVKPSNLLVETSGWLWVADFGLARIAGEGDQTSTGGMMGTPRYMSPEQVIGARRVVDHRTDVYSLGATLYELITLRPAFESSDRMELIVKIAEDEPRQPRQIDPAIPQDLETIVLKAMAKDPAGRFATARELADDLGRFLEGRPIHARPTTFLPRAVKWVRRRPMHGASAFLAVLLVFGSFGGIVYRDILIQRHDRQLEAEVIRADASARLSQRHLQAFQLRQAREAFDAGQVERAQSILLAIEPDRNSAAQGQAPGDQGFAWNYLMRNATKDLVVLSDRQTETIHSIAFSNDSQALASGDDDGTVRLRDPVSGHLLKSLPGHRMWVGGLVFSPDDRRLASAAILNTPPSRGEIIVWDLIAPRLLARIEGFSDRYVREVQFDQRGTRLWVGSADENSQRWIHFWDLSTDPAVPRLLWSARTNLAKLPVSADGAIVASEEPGREFVVRDIVKNKELGRAPPIDERYTLAIPSPDGRLLALYGSARTVFLWDLVAGRERARFALRRDDLVTIRFSPDCRYLSFDFRAGDFEIRDLVADKVQTIHKVGPYAYPHVRSAFSPDSRLLARYVSQPGSPQPTRIWLLDPWRLVAEYPGELAAAGDVLFTPDNGSLILQIGAAAIRWTFAPTPEPGQPIGHVAEAWSLAFSPDGSILASGSDDTDEKQTIKLWNSATGAFVYGWNAGPGTVSALAYGPGGRVLASAHFDKASGVRIWDTANGQQLAALAGHTAHVRTVAFSPDGNLLASAGSDRVIRLWDVATRRCLRVLTGHTDVIYQVAFSPDGTRLASASNDSTVNLWHVATGILERTLRAVESVQAVVFAPDGLTLALADEKGMVSVWDARSGSRLRSMAFESDYLLCLAYSPDGRSLAASGKTRTIRLWDPLTGQELLSLDGHKAQVNSVAFSPDGSTLASCSHDGVVTLWRSSPRGR
jgi:eukaryotic-like serine/threonine-protein kinase